MLSKINGSDMGAGLPLLTVSMLEVSANIVQLWASEGELVKKMELTLVRLGCLQNRFCGPNLTSRCPGGGLLWKPLMVMNGVIRDGR